MLDFMYSVPPTHLSQDSGVSWGLMDGFAQPATRASRRRAGPNHHGALDWVSATRPATATWLSPAPLAGAAPGVVDVAQTFARMLDEIDYGVALLTSDAHLLYANHIARHTIAQQLSLRQVAYTLTAARESEQKGFHQAVAVASQGKRSMLALGDADAPLMVAFTPVEGPGNLSADAVDPRVLLTFAKSAVCEPLSFRMFAKLYALSATESEVLRAAVDGHTAVEIAELQGVAMSTVRTHLNNIRAKTGARTMRALVARVGTLPPIVPAARF